METTVFLARVLRTVCKSVLKKSFSVGLRDKNWLQISFLKAHVFLFYNYLYYIINGFRSVSLHKIWIEFLLHQMSLIAGGKCQSFESNLHFELPCKLQCVKLFIKFLISFWCKALVYMSQNHFHDSYFLKLKHPEA